ncbi:MAG TPA: DNA-processing protein DprA [Acidimicrobiales bacterium]|nr:DNA-processing protein DprA [Acidimicrobiales bacterium]
MSGPGVSEPPGAAQPGDELPPAAWAAAVSGLPAMGPARLAAVLGQWEPAEAWRVVAGGRAFAAPIVARACRPDPHGVAAAWARAAAQVDVGETWEALGRAGVRVLVRGDAGYPADLLDDHEAPAVVFARGDPEVLAARRVAIVGTRQCSGYGADVARELGRDLAGAGVAVVSGLALGIDGAAHAGALDAAATPPVAVVGSGLDVVYPRRHARLWEEVAQRGLLLSEAPLGARPEPWRFPVRNRVIAALAEAVVVVESHVRGGSLHTVDAALARDRPVLAVPGSVRSPASAFPNALLADGCAPARDALDVLVVLGLSSGSAPASPRRPAPTGEEATVLAAVGWEPATLDEVVARSGLGPGRAGLLLARLEDDGWLVGRGGWWERLAGPAPASGA